MIMAGLKSILENFGCETSHKNIVIVTKNIQSPKGSIKNLPPQLKSCLTEFPNKHKKILDTELGIPHAAITLWYLTAAAMSYHRGEDYSIK